MSQEGKLQMDPICQERRSLYSPVAHFLQSTLSILTVPAPQSPHSRIPAKLAYCLARAGHYLQAMLTPGSRMVGGFAQLRDLHLVFSYYTSYVRRKISQRDPGFDLSTHYAFRK